MFHWCSEPSFRESVSRIPGVCRSYRGGWLAREVNRRPLFRRAGHRLHQPFESSVVQAPVRQKPPEVQTPSYGARGATLAIPTFMIGQGGVRSGRRNGYVAGNEGERFCETARLAGDGGTGVVDNAESREDGRPRRQGHDRMRRYRGRGTVGRGRNRRKLPGNSLDRQEEQQSNEVYCGQRGWSTRT